MSNDLTLLLPLSTRDEASLSGPSGGGVEKDRLRSAVAADRRALSCTAHH